MKKMIQQRLIANVVIDKCMQNPNLIFRDAWCSQDRVVRFTTPMFRRLFSYKESEKGKWKTGDCVMYEVNNSGDALMVSCVMNMPAISHEDKGVRDALLKAATVIQKPGAEDAVLASWEVSGDGDVNRLLEDFGKLIEETVPDFEQVLQKKLDSTDFSEDVPIVLREGGSSMVALNKYERNSKARAACLAACGTACKVCGVDFEKEYGPEFAGKIEVHHIVPLSEIGEEYEVDPVKDLVPICPNCHFIIHSKKDGVYTVEELKAMRAKL